MCLLISPPNWRPRAGPRDEYRPAQARTAGPAMRLNRPRPLPSETTARPHQLTPIGPTVAELPLCPGRIRRRNGHRGTTAQWRARGFGPDRRRGRHSRRPTERSASDQSRAAARRCRDAGPARHCAVPALRLSRTDQRRVPGPRAVTDVPLDDLGHNPGRSWARCTVPPPSHQTRRRHLDRPARCAPEGRV
jgi:hypothetical protein